MKCLKKRFIFILALSLIFLLTSCTKDSQGNGPLSNNNVTSKNGKEDISSLIPDGWHILQRAEGKPEEAEGDLNNDGINDIAIVIEETNKSIEAAPKRALMVVFGNKDKTYTLSVIAENAILKADEGGVFGDPLEGISIDRGSLLISFYGGSNWRWYRTYRFRFQDNDWYLIGATLGSYFTGNATEENADEEDYNLLTGDYITKKADEKGNIQTTKGNRGKKELLKLKDFVANSEEIQF